MASPLLEIRKITNPETPRDARVLAIRGFAEALDWTPSYEFEGTFGVGSAADHLIVEHGLDYSAVITFLRAPSRASDLSLAQMRSLLAISYNNLVEWHVFVSEVDIRRVNNLSLGFDDEEADQTFQMRESDFVSRLSPSEISKLRGSSELSRRVQACDDAVIQVLERWKGLLKADYPECTNQSPSTLFNAIIFVRGCEDRRLANAGTGQRLLLDIVAQLQGDTIDIGTALAECLSKTDVSKGLGQFINLDDLAVFRSFDRSTANNLFRDFYTPRDAAYDLNFALLSKHALSRIYERYVAIFKTDDAATTSQASLFPPVPEQVLPQRSGAVYTPQFIAGFFGRFIRENTTPRTFRSLRSIDPACGSGIFLPTLLELQCNPLAPGTTAASIKEVFGITEGIDRDANAVAATTLSLTLLHLVATESLPDVLPIRRSDAVGDALSGTIAKGRYGAMLSNPPYVKLDHLVAAEKALYEEYLGDDFTGRSDAYLAFVKLSIDAVAPNGFVCLVLPQTFLTARNARFLRRRISSEFDVRCLVDLSAVDVFEGVGAYCVLLVVQKKTVPKIAGEDAQLAQASDFVGGVLQACIDRRDVDTPYYRAFRTPQSYFERQDWAIVSPEFTALESKLARLPKLSDYLNSAQGFLTGADPVFLRSADLVPLGERSIYMYVWEDRDISRFGLKEKSDTLVLYPYEGDRLLDEHEIEERYPSTYSHLVANREVLTRRKRSSSTPWWKPERPRPPKVMKRPKIVVPHLFLTPRFALDISGVMAVSHTPFLTAKREDGEVDLLKWFVAVLNSSVASWYLRVFTPKFAKGYSRIEAATLRDVPVPDLNSVSAGDLKLAAILVDRLLAGKASEADAQDLDALIVRAYGITPMERSRILGLAG